MDNMRRRTCATEFKTLDGERRIPTEAELRAQARELGIPVPRAPEGTVERFRDDMLELLSATPEPVATKRLALPVQIASFEC